MALGRKTGGRTKGTPNKTTLRSRQVITDILESYLNSKTFSEDLASLEPKDRVAAMEKFAQYVVPKLQATSLDVISENKKTIEDRLIELSEEE